MFPSNEKSLSDCKKTSGKLSHGDFFATCLKPLPRKLINLTFPAPQLHIT